MRLGVGAFRLDDGSFTERSMQARSLLRSDAERHVGLERERRRFRIVRRTRAEGFVSAFEFAERIGAKVSEFFADLFGESAEVGNYHSGFAGEAGAQRFVLRGDAYWASVEMAL